MRVVVESTAAAAGDYIASTIVQFLRRESDAVLGLATGSSPLRVYESLRNSYRKGQVSFKRSKLFPAGRICRTWTRSSEVVPILRS